ncbi:MAG: S8 family serine peptidase [Phycisphaerales bacterium]|nr:S8 family serine peptidase [Phycisphaerales bacterium]
MPSFPYQPCVRVALAILCAGSAIGLAGLNAHAQVRTLVDASAASESSEIASGATMSVPLAVGERRGVVISPDGAQSVLRDPLGPGGWADVLVRSRVVVRSMARGPVDELALKSPGSSVQGLGDIAGVDDPQKSLAAFWFIDTTNVREAVRLAGLARADARIDEAYVDSKRSNLRGVPTDPLIGQQWYVNNSALPAASTNVIPAWMGGFTGMGVTVGIIDAGLNAAHPDLAANFNASASQTDLGFPDDHATACAGLVAMVPNNARGGAGIAYNAKVSRLYYGFDSDNAVALAFRNDLNAVKSNSWGPVDNGSLGIISSVEFAAMQSAATSGRGGKGTVIVWAAGNGRQTNMDRCDYDQYASSRYVLSVGAIDNMDRAASYSEPGSSLALVTTSSFDFFGSGGSGILTASGSGITPPGSYTPGFGGTSAAAPIASGVVALVLQANPNLTWRDVHHVLIRTARRVNPLDESWVLNAAGRWVSDQFGYGAIDAGAATALASGPLVLVPAEKTWNSPTINVNKVIPDNQLAGVVSSVAVPANLAIERVQIVLSAPHPRLGDLRVELIAPSGTRSVLADARSDFTAGYGTFTFTSLRHWDEKARGTWTLRVSDLVGGSEGNVSNWQLRIIGSESSCPCNWNQGVLGGSAALNASDIFDFLNDWFAGLGDFNNDGLSTPSDIFEFLNCWFAWCS